MAPVKPKVMAPEGYNRSLGAIGGIPVSEVVEAYRERYFESLPDKALEEYNEGLRGGYVSTPGTYYGKLGEIIRELKSR